MCWSRSATIWPQFCCTQLQLKKGLPVASILCTLSVAGRDDAG